MMSDETNPAMLAGTPSPAQAIAQIAADIGRYLKDGSPDREVDNLSLAQRCGLRTDGIAKQWAAAKADRAKASLEQTVIKPALPNAGTAAPQPTEHPWIKGSVRRDFGKEKANAAAKLEAEPIVAGAAAQPQPEPTPNVAQRRPVPKAFAKPEPEPEPAASPRVQLPAVIEPSPQAATFIPPGIELGIAEMNNKHAVITDVGGKCVVMELVPSILFPGTKELNFQSFPTHRERYGNRYVTISRGPRKTEEVQLGHYWLVHPQRREYAGLVLRPNEPEVLPGNYLNLWQGWGVQPQAGDWGLIQRHIAEVLAAGDQRFADYILRWTAWKFQNPGSPTRAALVLRGGKGSGKGVLGQILMRIFGPHGLQIFNSEHMTGKHNSHLQNKLFLFSDEATWAGDHKAERVLKGLVTEPFQMIEPKNVNAFMWPNHIGLYMAANAKWVVPASADERRFAVNTVSERWKQNPIYFRPLFDEIAGGGAAAMLHDLLRFDLDGWHPGENIPATKALLEQKLQGLTGLEQWWVYMLGCGLHPAGGNPKNPRRVSSKKLLAEAKEYSTRNRYITPEELAAFLKDHGFVSKSDGTTRGWIVPPLAEARDRWSAASGGDWPWDHPEKEEWGSSPVIGT